MASVNEGIVENFKYYATLAQQRRVHLDRMFVLAVSGVTLLLTIGDTAISPEMIPLAALALLFPTAVRTLHSADQHFEFVCICNSFFNDHVWGLEALKEARDSVKKGELWKPVARHSFAILFLFLALLALTQSWLLADKHASVVVLVEGVIGFIVMLIPIVGLFFLNTRRAWRRYSDAIRLSTRTRADESQQSR